jgi:UDP-N-acetylglucosamine--N-acetylmuramyl-(pentapeptide) pyrophosphoryl-undecaprenol N-acetylglucosamine transferase
MNMKKNNQTKLIMLSGGGTGGSVTPLLALADYLKQDNPAAYNFIFVGTNSGPEKYLVESSGLQFLPIMSGKWRRYFSWKNFSDIFKIGGAFFQSIYLLRKYRPDLLISAGGFVSVPLAYAAYCRRIPVLIHQQDIRAGLANKLMARVASQVTVTFEKSLKDYGSRALWVGNPVSERRDNSLDLWRKYNLDAKRPLLLVLGGGTGSAFINWLIKDSLKSLLELGQVIHITGSGKKENLVQTAGYLPLEFMNHEEVLWFMARSRGIVSRCGLGVLTEISTLGKAAILIPMPDSHQEDNAAIFQAQKAAIVLSEKNISTDIFIDSVRELMTNKKLHDDLCSFVKDVVKPANAEMKKIVAKLLP